MHMKHFEICIIIIIIIIIIRVLCPRVSPSLQAQDPRLYFCRRQVSSYKLEICIIKHGRLAR